MIKSSVKPRDRKEYFQEYYKKRKESILKKLNKKYRNNAAFKEKTKKKYLKRYHEDPIYHKATLERARNRYHTDPEYRKATIMRSRKRRLKSKIKNKKKT